MNYKEIIKKQSFIITASVIVMAIILLGTSYALFANRDNSDTQVVSSGTLIVSYSGTTITTVGGSDSTEIEPIAESTVDTQDPYIIKVKNNGTLAMKYNIVIYTTSSNTLPHSYYAIKYKDNGEYTSKQSLTALTKVDNTITNMNEIKYKLNTEPLIINPGVERTHEIKLWIDEDTADDAMDDKVANIKIMVEGEATDPVETQETLAQYITNLAQTDDSIVDDETEDHNIRYIGANPNNYVSFNNELWRIIGVMNNIENSSGQVQSLVKIIRAESLGNYSWDSSASGVNGGHGVNEWSQADLMQELNNDYLGNVTIGTDGNWYSGYNNAKANTKPTSTISSEEQNKIESVKWNLGSPSNNAGSYDSNWTSISASTAYIRERSNYTGKVCTSGTYCNDTVTRTSSWTGKIGLFYPSDYLYATSGGNATNRQTCLGLGMYTDWSNSSYANCKDNDWLKPASGYTWSLSPRASSSYAAHVFLVISTGNVNDYDANGARGVRPVVFLKSSISITGGDGSSTNPYII